MINLLLKHLKIKGIELTQFNSKCSFINFTINQNLDIKYKDILNDVNILNYTLIYDGKLINTNHFVFYILKNLSSLDKHIIQTIYKKYTKDVIGKRNIDDKFLTKLSFIIFDDILNKILQIIKDIDLNNIFKIHLSTISKEEKKIRIKNIIKKIN